MDVLDEVVKESIAKQAGIPVEGLSDLYSEIKEHVRLKDAVVEAAKGWERVSEAGDTQWNVASAMARLSISTRALLQFEQEHPA